MTYVIIIGGTGMLSCASRKITSQVDDVLLIARNPGKLAIDINARPLQLDWKVKPTTEASIGLLKSEPKADILISWIHDDGLWCLQQFEDLLVKGGRSIRVHGSAAGDPSEGVKTDPPPIRNDIQRQNIVLGWKEENGRRRWLTDDEISEGVITAFKNPKLTSMIVGQIDRIESNIGVDDNTARAPIFHHSL
jgi:hypothetical protein